jgi:D-alanyl-D-alanine carboxypeptidase/D-alanyl-D-alanine-endopeptidase (penicillin-binding protein 4)
MLACYGTPASASPSRQPTTASPSIDTLQHRVDALLASPDLAAGTWGIAVRSLTTGETLVASNAHRLLTPASTLKTLTLAVAADELGWNYTYATTLVAHGAIANGVLDGDLVVVGSGDPSLDDWDGAASSLFADWATLLKGMGVTRVTGRIVGDARAFADDGIGSGWAWDDLELSYSAPARALQFNEGTARIMVTSGAATGTPALLTLMPPYASVTLRGRVDTGSAGSGRIVTVGPLSRDRGVGVSGSIALDARSVLRNVAVDDPVRYFATAVRFGLEANGIAIIGDAIDLTETNELRGDATQAVVAVYQSAPLPVLADTMMKMSQNLFAESLLRALGLTHSGVGTGDAGRAVVQERLTDWGVPSGEALIADGSGLSRYNLVTADALTSVLAHVYSDERLRNPYVASLPVAGRSGTLSARLRGTAADGRVQAKTGSFTNARSIAGFVRTADNEPLAFAIIANNYGVAPAAIDRVTDAIVVSLAEFRRR